MAGSEEFCKINISAQFEPEIHVKITAAVGMINLWSRLSISFRKMHPVDKAG